MVLTMIASPRNKPSSAPGADGIDENGVDRNQIREMLQLTPEQRLSRVQLFVESVQQIRELNEERPVR